MGLQLASWAKLLALQEGSLPAAQEAMRAVEEALDILQATHGRASGRSERQFHCIDLCKSPLFVHSDIPHVDIASS